MFDFFGFDTVRQSFMSVFIVLVGLAALIAFIALVRSSFKQYKYDTYTLPEIDNPEDEVKEKETDNSLFDLSVVDETPEELNENIGGPDSPLPEVETAKKMKSSQLTRGDFSNLANIFEKSDNDKNDDSNSENLSKDELIIVEEVGPTTSEPVSNEENSKFEEERESLESSLNTTKNDVVLSFYEDSKESDAHLENDFSSIKPAPPINEDYTQDNSSSEHLKKLSESEEEYDFFNPKFGEEQNNDEVLNSPDPVIVDGRTLNSNDAENEILNTENNEIHVIEPVQEEVSIDTTVGVVTPPKRKRFWNRKGDK